MLTKLLYKPTEAAQVLGMSRTSLFHLLSTGELESVKIGGLRRIPAIALENYVQGLREKPPESRAETAAS